MNNEMLIAILKIHAIAVAQVAAIMAVSAVGLYIGYKFWLWFFFNPISQPVWKVGDRFTFSNGTVAEVVEVVDTTISYRVIARPHEERALTRNERLQEAADAGFDTWEDYRGER